MILQLKKIIVNSETDFIEDDIEKVLADITIVANLIGKNETREIPISTQVVSLNNDRGFEMDAQREIHCENLINKF